MYSSCKAKSILYSDVYQNAAAAKKFNPSTLQQFGVGHSSISDDLEISKFIFTLLLMRVADRVIKVSNGLC